MQSELECFGVSGIMLFHSKYLRVIFLLHMQALYFCVPFREQLLDYYSNNKNPSDAEENLLTCLADLFLQVNYIWNWLNIKSNNFAG